MDELRRLRGLLKTALALVEDLDVDDDRRYHTDLKTLVRMREIISLIEPAYEVALLRCEQEVERD